MKLSALLVDAREGLAAAGGAAGLLVADGLLSGQVEHWVTGVIAAATAGIVALLNAPTVKGRRRRRGK